ncbi:carboxypeptidase-like protein [Ancylomarina subtilis]|uniref:Carboxypeptidase-like protein n=1 Tax=Ancylomarina subtilis TaxID=1639035 RepID=A0A4Q7VLB5_9BACT|nr:carboxypeptidase-like regulatory domain-containing protein [Ancylomarina subtilis]RZT97066.1 carboxypeptidase-like protein [Ancylomarina subtilis]
MRLTWLLIFLFTSASLWGQKQLTGIVIDQNQKPVFAANVYWKQHPQLGVVTDFDGKFSILLPTQQNPKQLLVSFIGFKTQVITWNEIKQQEKIVIQLKEENRQLKTINVTAKDPISQKFSVIRMEKIDVYLSPVASGDPLKAITFLPSSTNTDEMANPALRGSSSDKSRVILNGVPILKPVRNSQINGMGNFSLFNTEIIHKQYVYASNPPLNYGNTSAGLVEIETVQKLDQNSSQISTSLASLGFFISKKLKKESLIQLYGNWQFDDAFLNVNKHSLDLLKDFKSKDAGLNLRLKLHDNLCLNSFNYLIDEQFNVLDYMYGYQGKSIADNLRLISITNLHYTTNNGLLSLNLGLDAAKNKYHFANLFSRGLNKTIYISANYKWSTKNRHKFQFGLSEEYKYDRFHDSIPLNYYNVKTEAPNYYQKTNLNNHNTEGYIYWNYELASNFSLSTAARINLPTSKQNFYWSGQISMRYNLNKDQSFLLSGGQYHNYNTPNYYQRDYALNRSYQVAIDYDYKLERSNYHLALYCKKEHGDWKDENYHNFKDVRIAGLEFSTNHFFGPYLNFSLSNTLLKQDIQNANQWYPGSQSLDYFTKISLSFNHPGLLNLSATWIARPGLRYTPLKEVLHNPATDTWQPVLSEDINNKRYASYNNLSVNTSRILQLGKVSLIAFASITNLLNKKNQNTKQYNTDYSSSEFNYYEKRIYYFGLIWQLKGR